MFDVAVTSFREAVEAGRAYGPLYNVTFARLVYANVLYLTGRLADARTELLDVLGDVRASTMIRILVAQFGTALAVALRDDALFARCYTPDVLEEAFSTNEPIQYAPLAAAIAEHHLANGDDTAAVALLERMLAALPDGWGDAEALLPVAVCCAQADVERARVRFDAAAPPRPRCVRRSVPGAVRCIRRGAFREPRCQSPPSESSRRDVAAAGHAAVRGRSLRARGRACAHRRAVRDDRRPTATAPPRTARRSAVRPRRSSRPANERSSTSHCAVYRTVRSPASSRSARGPWKLTSRLRTGSSASGRAASSSACFGLRRQTRMAGRDRDNGLTASVGIADRDRPVLGRGQRQPRLAVAQDRRHHWGRRH